MNVRLIQLPSISLSGGTQPRTEISEALVAEYAEAMLAGAEFPPVVVFEDGADRWLADGFHRWHAANKLNTANILADLRQGSRRQAVLFSVAANVSHGLRRSNADKRKAVMTLLADEEWGQWSDNTIAEYCGVGRQYVNEMRRATCRQTTSNPRRYSRKGKAQEMNTDDIGRTRRSVIEKALKEDPHASSNAIALRCATSTSFVSRVRGELDLPASRFLNQSGYSERLRRFSLAMDSLEGFVMGLQGAEEFAGEARAEYWCGQISKLVNALRDLRQELMRKDKEKEIA